MTQRAESAEATRQRIVEATLQLHAERGVQATSHKDVARLADVSVGTVYHHFPTIDAIVRACGAHVREQYPFPNPAVIDPRQPRPSRIAMMTLEIVGSYAAMPWSERIRAERQAVPALDAGLALREDAVKELVRRAIGKSATAAKVAVVAAILDPAVINRLLESGMSKQQTAKTLAAVINAWLEGGRS